MSQEEPQLSWSQAVSMENERLSNCNLSHEDWTDATRWGGCCRFKYDSFSSDVQGAARAVHETVASASSGISCWSPPYPKLHHNRTNDEELLRMHCQRPNRVGYAGKMARQTEEGLSCGVECGTRLGVLIISPPTVLPNSSWLIFGPHASVNHMVKSHGLLGPRNQLYIRSKILSERKKSRTICDQNVALDLWRLQAFVCRLQ